MSEIIAYKLNEPEAEWVVISGDQRMLLDKDCVRQAVIDYFVKYLSKPDEVEEIDLQDSCVFEDTAGALTHISEMVNHTLKVDYSDPNGPILHIDGTDVHVGQIVCKDKNGDIFIAG